MKYTTLNPIAALGLSMLPDTYEKTENVEEADAILVRSFQMLDMEFSKNLKCIGRAGAGVNNIPVEKCAEQGIVVFNTPGANANAVKELTIAAMLLAARDIKGGMKWVEDNKGDENIAKTMEKAKAKYGGTEILGKTLGLLGLGAIGMLVANAAVALGMDVYAYDIVPPKAGLDSRVKFTDSQEKLYLASDYISIHVPENDKTRGMVNKDAFAKMKDGVVLLNIARAGLINDDDLQAALESGKVLKYVTDVPDFKTANMKNVIAFPHLGASTEEAEDNCAVMAAKELTDFLENGNITNSVNFPNVSLGQKTGERVLVLFKEGADVEEIKSALAGFTAFETNTRRGYGAALFSAAQFYEEAVETVKSIPGVISARVI